MRKSHKETPVEIIEHVAPRFNTNFKRVFEPYVKNPEQQELTEEIVNAGIPAVHVQDLADALREVL